MSKELKTKLEALKHFRLPFQGNKGCMKIFDADGRMVADIRGWGWLTGKGGGLGLSEEEAIKAQEDLMDFIVAAANAAPSFLEK